MPISLSFEDDTLRVNQYALQSYIEPREPRLMRCEYTFMSS